METWEFIRDVISNNVFSIAVAAYLLYQNKYEADKHDKEVDSLRQSLENNTIAITKLCMTIEHEGLKND